MKWKAMLVGVAILAAAAVSPALAASSTSTFLDRDGSGSSYNYLRGQALVGNEKVEFAREMWETYVNVEVQHILGDKDAWFLHIQDTTADKRKVSFSDVTILQKEKSYVLTPLKDIPQGNPMWKDTEDLWYEMPQELVRMIAASPNGWKLQATQKNGKIFKHTFKNLAEKLVILVQEPATSALYGSMYSVFFPGKDAKEVRNAFLYNINVRDEHEKITASLDSYCWYCVGQDIDNAEFSGNAEDGTYSGYTAFRTTSQGTWVDLDFWHNYYTASSNGFGGKIYTPQTNSNIKDYFVNNALRAVQKSYQDIETHPDYGITLAGGFSKSNPKVETVDVENHPELAKVAPGDWILSINGIDVTGKNYYASYALDFAPANTTLHITFKNDMTGEYTVDAVPIMKNRNKPDDFPFADYVCKKEGLEEKGIPSEGLLLIPIKEVFDPYGGDEAHIHSPRTYFIAKAIGIF